MWRKSGKPDVLVTYVERSRMPIYNNQASGHCFDLLDIAMYVKTTTTSATTASNTVTPMPGSRVVVLSSQIPFISPSFTARA
jgi:hypothetical protein